MTNSSTVNLRATPTSGPGDSTGAELLPPVFGDQLPSVPNDRTPPELTSAKTAGIRFRQAWLRLRYPRRVRPLLPARDMIKRLVVVHPGGLRDLVFAEPALRALRRAYPDAQRVLYADAPAARELMAGTGWGEVLPLAKLAKERGKSSDDGLVIDFTREVEYDRAQQLKGLGITHRSGYVAGGRDAYFTLPLDWPGVDVHDVDAALRAVERLGAPSLGAMPDLPHGPDRQERGWKLWQDSERSRPVVLAPGWEGAPYGWPEAVFFEVGRRLKGRAAVITRAGEEERGLDLAASIPCPHVHDPAPRELMDRLATAGLVIGNDGGVVHLAAALGVPVVMLTLNPQPWRTWPRAKAGAVAYRAQVDGGKVDFDRVSSAEITAMGLQLLQPDD